MNGRHPVRMLACALVIAAAACGEPPSPPQGGTVVIAAGAELDFANPLVSVDAWTNEILRYVLFTPLIRYAPDLTFEPALAESWEMEGDTAVVFHLRRDVWWHDGRPTTAHDVLFTFDRAVDPATGFPNADYFAHWTGGVVLDSFTIRFRMRPHAEPLGGWPFTPIVPEHLLDTIPPERLRQAAFNTDPVGNGPFRFVSHRPGDRWVFEANPEYPEALGGPPALDRLVWRVVPESAAQIAELRVGEADLALQPRPGTEEELAQHEGIRAVRKPSRNFSFIAWNGKRPPLDDARVRHALALAIDRQAILTGLRHGLGELGVGPVGPFHWAWADALEPLAFDPDSALAILDQAGIRDRDADDTLERADGSDFAIELKLVAGRELSRDVAEAVRSDLAAIGIDATTRATEMTTLFSDVTSPDRRFDAALLGWTADFRLDLRDLFHSGSLDGPYQFASYGNAEVDSLMDAAVRIPDRSASGPIWTRIQEVLLAEQPWTLLYYQTDVFLARERVRNLDMDIRGALVHVADWWVDPTDGGVPAQQNTGG
ncbi:MAG: ABC transporter substrate-binding protein [Longimicrobiales bacterium]|nr:ABC transporter substrate-binding protein [Longimicrobiales bacterium]